MTRSTLVAAAMPLVLTVTLVGCASRGGSPAPAASSPPPAAAEEAKKPAPPRPDPAPSSPDMLVTPSPDDPPPPTRPWSDDELERVPRGLDLPAAPADGVWFQDEDTGAYYHVYGLQRVENAYKLTDDGARVRIAYGLSFDVVALDDEYVYVKLYRPVPRVSRPRPAEQPLEPIPALPATVDRLEFAGFAEGLPSEGQWRQGIAVGDVNEDGHRDLVLAPVRKGRPAPTIFLGDGQGRWRAWREATFPARRLDYGDIEVADFDGDGHLDLALASHLMGVTVMRGDGRGRFALWSEGIPYVGEAEPESGPVPSSRTLTVVDWNADRRPDLLVMGEGPRLALDRTGKSAQGYSEGTRGVLLLLNGGDGRWTMRFNEKYPSALYSDAIATGRFDDDDRIDFVHGASAAGARALVQLHTEDDGWKPVSLPLPQSLLPRAVGVADFDGDGRDDILVGGHQLRGKTHRARVDLFLNRGGEWQHRPVAVVESQAGVWSVDTGDLDADGDADAVALTGDGKAWVMVGDGKGGLLLEEAPELAADSGCTGFAVAIEDLDGRPGDELVTAWAGEPRLHPVLGARLGECTGEGSLRAYRAVVKGGRR